MEEACLHCKVLNAKFEATKIPNKAKLSHPKDEK